MSHDLLHMHSLVSERAAAPGSARDRAGAPSAAPAGDGANNNSVHSMRGSMTSDDESAHNGSLYESSGFRKTRRRGSKQQNNDFAAGHLRAKDIVHINTRTKLLDFTQRVITPDKVTATDVGIFLVLYAGSIFIFAFLLLACSPDGECYHLDVENGTRIEFGYDTALWISMHSFSTIGFGSLAPRQKCTGAQIIIFIESFVALVVYGFISGYIVKMFLRPLSRIRFSKNLLLNNGRRRVETEDDELESVRGRGHYKYLTFRMVREGRVQMRNVHVRMQAQYWHAGKNHSGLQGREHHKGRVVSLTLEQDYFTTIEQLQVWHRLDENSPLWKMREHLGDHLDGVEVSVSAFDMASLQPVMMFKRYDVSDVIINAVFDNNFAYNPKDETRQQLQADHARLDNYIEEEKSGPDLQQTRSSSRQRRDSNARVNFRPANFMPIPIPGLQRSNSQGGASFGRRGSNGTPPSSPPLQPTKGGSSSFDVPEQSLGETSTGSKSGANGSSTGQGPTVGWFWPGSKKKEEGDSFNNKKGDLEEGSGGGGSRARRNSKEAAVDTKGDRPLFSPRGRNGATVAV